MADIIQPIVYVKWRDACHEMLEFSIAELGDLAELHSIGWLLKDMPDTITLGLEAQDGMDSARLWMTIPKSGIVEMHRLTLDKLLQAAKPRVRKPRKPSTEPAV